MAREIKLNSKIPFDGELTQPRVVAGRDYATEVARAAGDPASGNFDQYSWRGSLSDCGAENERLMPEPIRLMF